jgi:hypothetical protein
VLTILVLEHIPSLAPLRHTALDPLELEVLPWMVPVFLLDLEEAGVAEEDGEHGAAEADAEDDTVDETVKMKMRLASQAKRASTLKVRVKARPEREKRPTRTAPKVVAVAGAIMAMEEVDLMDLEQEVDGAITAAMVMDHMDAEVLLHLTPHKVEWVHSI